MGAGERYEECARCSCHCGGKITIYAREIGGQWVSLRSAIQGLGSLLRCDKIFEPGASTKSGGGVLA